MKTCLSVLLGLVLAVPLLATSPGATDEEALPPAPVCEAETPLPSALTGDVSDQKARPDLGTPDPTPTCHTCEDYCWNEYQFCLSGCTDFLCEIGCEQQYNDCIDFCRTGCW